MNLVVCLCVHVRICVHACVLACEVCWSVVPMVQVRF